MALTTKTLDARELATAIETIYTVPASTTTRLTEMWVSNNAGVARTFIVHIVNSGGSAGDDNKLIASMDAPVGTPLIFALNTFLDTGDFIRAYASGADVAIRVSGIEEA